MADTSSPSDSPTASRGRGRGRGKRGGFGKYLRARGRRGGGRPAEFNRRLLLDGEQQDEIDSEEAAEIERKYANRPIVSREPRTVEPVPSAGGPSANSEEEEEEPEVDLSAFLARQRLTDNADAAPLGLGTEADHEDEDVDESLMHLNPANKDGLSRKGPVRTIEWDESLEEMLKEKEAADANRELKSRFRADIEKQKKRQTRPQPAKSKLRVEKLEEAPPLPGGEPAEPKTEKEQMEDFLDDLLG